MVLCKKDTSEDNDMTQIMVIAWMQSCVLFPHMFIGFENTSLIEQIPYGITQTLLAQNDEKMKSLPFHKNTPHANARRSHVPKFDEYGPPDI